LAGREDPSHELVLGQNPDARLPAVDHGRRGVVGLVADGKIREHGHVDDVGRDAGALDGEPSRQRHGCRAAESRRRVQHLEMQRRAIHGLPRAETDARAGEAAHVSGTSPAKTLNGERRAAARPWRTRDSPLPAQCTDNPLR
jgi:hypothetical protein